MQGEEGPCSDFAVWPCFCVPFDNNFHAAQVAFSARLTAYTVATFTSALQDGYVARMKAVLATGGANCQVSITGVRAGSVIVDTKARESLNPKSPPLACWAHVL